MVEKETIKMLFELHHRQLRETHISFRSTTERVVALFALITGWIVLSTSNPPWNLRWILITGVLSLSVAAVAVLYRAAIGRKRIASVIQKLNRKLKLYDRGAVVQNTSLYPDKWQSYGDEAPIIYVAPHILFISLMAALTVFSIVAK